jgi:hypothetical protein
VTKSRILLSLSAIALSAGLLIAPAKAQSTAAAAPAAAAPAAAAGPVPTVVGQTVTAVAVVESIDYKTRQVLLTPPSGQPETIVAGPGVRNLDKVKPGDQVVLTLQQAVAVQLSKPDAALPAPSAESGAVRAAKGQLPAGATYTLVDVHVHITAVDTATHEVSFTRADGSTGKITVKNPALQHFAAGLKPGDNVEIQYLQAVSIQVQKP